MLDALASAHITAITAAAVIKSDEGKNIEIYDHLADVLLALGEKAQAVETWKKALKLEANSLREQHRRAEIEKKLKANE